MEEIMLTADLVRCQADEQQRQCPLHFVNCKGKQMVRFMIIYLFRVIKCVNKLSQITKYIKYIKRKNIIKNAANLFSLSNLHLFFFWQFVAQTNNKDKLNFKLKIQLADNTETTETTGRREGRKEGG